MALPSGAGRRARIMEAAESLLMQHGLHGWSVEQVARAAECAKGLVHYHFGTRAGLLAAVAGAIGQQRIEQRVHALALRGTAALDALFAVLRQDAEDGRSKAWLELGLNGAAELHAAMAPSAEQVDMFAAAGGAALEMPPLRPDRARALLLVLDGLEAGLVRGARQADIREAYDRVWLAMLG
jgi:AcrR family transcriptional regulator